MESVEELCDNIALINNSKKILDGEVQEVKSRFKSNVFELIYSKKPHTISNILNDKFELLENHNAKETSQAKIKIKEGTPNDLLSLLIPHTQILSFNEVIPSMNDIFIQRVAESDKLNNEGHE
jgi:ABC-2 type transport system ATP-binding protein